MSGPTAHLRRFAVRGVFWRQYLDWAIINVPFYFQPPLLFFCTIFFFFFAAATRRAVVANLAVVRPGSSGLVNHFRAFRTLHEFAWAITDAATFKLKQGTVACEIDGAQFLDQLATARGAIVLTAHIGNYDLGAGLFAQKFGREIRMVRAPEADEKTEAHLKSSLQEIGRGAVRVDYATQGALLSFDLLSALRLGEIVSIQGDRIAGAVAETEARMFGAPVRIPTGPFILALAAQVPLYPLFITRRGYRRYRIIVREPIVTLRSGRERERDIEAAVARWCSVLQEVITAHWEQWFAFTRGF
ncbi:MAG: hypothetical protein ABI871_04700 [Chthoniobacterales bacterium]